MSPNTILHELTNKSKNICLLIINALPFAFFIAVVRQCNLPVKFFFFPQVIQRAYKIHLLLLLYMQVPFSDIHIKRSIPGYSYKA